MGERREKLSVDHFLMLRRLFCCRSGDRPPAQDGSAPQKMNPGDGMSSGLSSTCITLFSFHPTNIFLLSIAE